MRNKKQNTLTIVLFMIYLLLLTGIILFKFPFYSGKVDLVRVVNLIPFYGSFDENGDLLFREIINNTLIFIPAGIYICTLKNEWSFVKKVLPVIGLTVTLEVLQFIFAIGRSDITDILDNTLGGLIGIGIYALLYNIFKNSTAKAVNILALSVTVCVLFCFTYFVYFSRFIQPDWLMLPVFV